MEETGIQQLNLTDVPSLSPGVKYYDGEVGFADDIRSIVKLSKAVKVNFIAMVFCTSGRITLRINDEPYEIGPRDGLLIDMQSVVSDIRYDDDMSCKIICVSLEGGVSLLTKGVFDAFIHLKEHRVVHFLEHEIELMSKYYELALFKMEHQEAGHQEKETMHLILRAYVLDIISYIRSHYASPEEKKGNIMRQSDKIFHRFMMLLARNDGSQRSVQEYASELCVSPKYLNSICRSIEDKTASELITMSTVGHIKQMLLYSSLSVKEIALQLGFDNLSFFGKYVKKHLGASPVNYRKMHNYGK